MKRYNIMLSSLALLFVFAMFQNAQTVEQSAAVAEHLKMAQYYDTQAAQQDALIAEHQQMKSDYKDKYYINEKVTPMAKFKEMEKHCDAIIKTAKQQKAEFLRFAEWHRLRAAELQGK